jgi:hypothetical protein
MKARDMEKLDLVPPFRWGVRGARVSECVASEKQKDRNCR